MTGFAVNVGRFIFTLTRALRPGAELALTYNADDGYVVGLDAPGVVYVSGPHRSPSEALVECVRWLRAEENAAVASELVDPAEPLPGTEPTVSDATARMLALAARHAPITFRDQYARLRTGTLIYWPIPITERTPADEAAPDQTPGRSGTKARVKLLSGAVISFDPLDLVQVNDTADRVGTVAR